MEAVKAFFAEKAPHINIIELPTSTATVALAAEAHGVEPGQIAKTLSFEVNQETILIVTSGDARIDNRKFKDIFSAKPKMLDAAVVESKTGHPVGGVCPFGVPDNLKIFCDISLKSYNIVVPAAGAINSAIKISPSEMADITNAQWIDVCK